MIIYKYTLETEKENLVDIPRGAVIIHCHEQGNKVCIWARVYSEAVKEIRKFIAVVTGIEYDGGDYVGTCHLDNGRFVVHIFETTHSTHL